MIRNLFDHGKRLALALSCVVCLCVSIKVSAADLPFITGADVSMLPTIEKCGGVLSSYLLIQGGHCDLANIGIKVPLPDPARSVAVRASGANLMIVDALRVANCSTINCTAPVCESPRSISGDHFPDLSDE